MPATWVREDRTSKQRMSSEDGFGRKRRRKPRERLDLHAVPADINLVRAPHYGRSRGRSAVSRLRLIYGLTVNWALPMTPGLVQVAVKVTTPPCVLASTSADVYVAW